MGLKHFLWLGAVGYILYGCSTEKDRFFNRFYHATLARYNIIFNAQLAFRKANNERILAYRDNFSEILPIEALEDKSHKPIQGSLPLYALVQQKVFKAVRNHSMEINEVERNPYMSRAYLMLSKAYYYEGRFQDALEVLDYIIASYPLSKKVYEARVWRENVKAELGYSSSAIFNYRVLRRLETFMTKSLRSRAYAMLSKSYLALEEEDKAIEFLEQGVKFVSNKKIKGRYYFILAQIYEKRKDYSNMIKYYTKVVKLKRRTKWAYYIHARLKKIEYAYLEGKEKKVERWLKRLIRNEYENSDYYNFIYFTAARYNEKIDSIDKAKLLYQKSIEAKVSSPDEYLMARAYERLADLYFKEASFLKAAQNYMGAMAFYDKKTRNYQRVYFRHKRIRTVIKLERMLQDMGFEMLHYEKHEKSSKQEKTPSNLRKIRYSEKKQAKFYFNSDKSVLEQGAKQFHEEWGNRSLVDNWRRVNWVDRVENHAKDESKLQQELFNNESAESADGQSIYDYDRIPIGALTKEQRLLKRDKAYYHLGLLYYEYLDHPKLAIKRLEKLLELSTNMDYVLPAYYLLFRAYNKLESKSRAQHYKRIIEAEYPKSIYASMVNYPDEVGLNAKSTNDRYRSVYRNYAVGNYKQAYKQCTDFIKMNFYHPALPRFKLLAALSLFKSGQRKKAEHWLEEIILEYPEAEEAKRADAILKAIEATWPSIQNQQSVKETI